MNTLFLIVSTILFAAIIFPGFYYLPKERWQIFASFPLHKHDQNQWRGVNLTFYGFIIATSTLIALAYMLVLFNSIGTSLLGIGLLFSSLLFIGVPASKIIAILVEKKKHTFTVGGAFFCGIISLPWLVLLINQALPVLGQQPMNLRATLAITGIGYIIGEGLGRLGCISFGCCYGKPLCDCSPWLQKLLAPVAFVFEGETKKVVYEGDLGGQKLVPIQAITCVIYISSGLFSIFLFLHGWFLSSFLVTLFVSQLWRVYSETMRADFRGFNQFTAYQKMSFISLPYGFLFYFLPSETLMTLPSIAQGLHILSEPVPMISIQVLWLALFIHFGRSMVTTSTLNFQVVKERI